MITIININGGGRLACREKASKDTGPTLALFLNRKPTKKEMRGT
jgi:hypothetical protein